MDVGLLHEGRVAVAVRELQERERRLDQGRRIQSCAKGSTRRKHLWMVYRLVEEGGAKVDAEKQVTSNRLHEFKVDFRHTQVRPRRSESLDAIRICDRGLK
jgi:hypothetical protein